jgi:hypothetical protein
MSSRKKRKAQQEDCAVCIIHSAKSTFFLPSFSQNIQSGLNIICQDQETYVILRASAVLSRRRRFMSNNFSKQSTEHDTKFLKVDAVGLLILTK